MQKPNESVSSFFNVLQTLAKECEFESDKPDTVVNQRTRDQFILGTLSEDIRKRLLIGRGAAHFEPGADLGKSFFGRSPVRKRVCDYACDCV